MYKLTCLNYSKEKPDLILLKDIKTIRNSSGLTLIVTDLKDKEIKVFSDYKGQYNTYREVSEYNSVTCSDEFKDYMKYETNFLISLSIEYAGN